MIKISVIVPVYNVKRYLPKCIDSLLNQDLPVEDYEIILVDDGSPDGCLAICDEYANTHDNVKVIHRQNGGLSAARNSGIEVAKGQYVQFVDSDDYLEPNVLKALVEKMDSDKLDILRFNYQNVNEQYEVFEPNKVSKPFVDYRDDVCDGLTFLTERLGFGCYAWQFVIRREMLPGCLFKEGIYFEDTQWTPRLLWKAQRVTKLLLVDSMKSQMQRVGDKRWFEGMIAQTAISIISYVAAIYYSQRKEVMKALVEKDIFPLSTYRASQTGKRKITWANISPNLLCFMLHLKN